MENIKNVKIDHKVVSYQIARVARVVKSLNIKYNLRIGIATFSNLLTTSIKAVKAERHAEMFIKNFSSSINTYAF